LCARKYTQHEDVDAVVFTSTALRWVRAHRDPSVTHSIKDLISDRRSRRVKFDNEHSAATFVERVPGATETEWHHDLILAAAEHYASTVADSADVVVLTTSDELRSRARRSASAASVLTVLEYVQRYHTGDTALLEQLESLEAALSAAASNAATRPLAAAKAARLTEGASAAYMPQEAVESGVKSGIYFSGPLFVDPYHQGEALVRVSFGSGGGGGSIGGGNDNSASPSSGSSDGKSAGSGGITEILVLGDVARNRAVHCDSVAVELLPREQWRPKTNQLKVAAVTDTSSPSHGGADDPSSSSSSARAPSLVAMPTGRVIRVLERNWRPYVATLQEGEVDKVRCPPTLQEIETPSLHALYCLCCVACSSRSQTILMSHPTERIFGLFCFHVSARTSFLFSFAEHAVFVLIYPSRQS
jgi:DIS3-like exonuclease 1